MDTGKLENTVFYDGYEGEGELILSIQDDKSDTSIIHIWEGYFEEIFGNPISTEEGWFDFTKDYQESARAFNGGERISPSGVSEYLYDLKNIKINHFRIPKLRMGMRTLLWTSLQPIKAILVIIQ